VSERRNTQLGEREGENIEHGRGWPRRHVGQRNPLTSQFSSASERHVATTHTDCRRRCCRCCCWTQGEVMRDQLAAAALPTTCVFGSSHLRPPSVGGLAYSQKGKKG